MSLTVESPFWQAPLSSSGERCCIGTFFLEEENSLVIPPHGGALGVSVKNKQS